MAGLAKILKIYGSMVVQNIDGKNDIWVWDHVNDKAVIKNRTVKKNKNHGK